MDSQDDKMTGCDDGMSIDTPSGYMWDSDLWGILPCLDTIAPSLWNILHSVISTTTATLPTATAYIIECVRHDSYTPVFRRVPD